jgi:hypothetical protein
MLVAGTDGLAVEVPVADSLEDHGLLEAGQGDVEAEVGQVPAAVLLVAAEQLLLARVAGGRACKRDPRFPPRSPSSAYSPGA